VVFCFLKAANEEFCPHQIYTQIMQNISTTDLLTRPWQVPLSGQIAFNLSAEALVAEALRNGEAQLADTGAIQCLTGRFTGRSPQDKYLVKDDQTAAQVWWGDINQAIDPQTFEQVHQDMLTFLQDKKIYIRQAMAGAHPDYRLHLEIINTQAWQNLFCHHLFLRPSAVELTHFKSDFRIICVPEFKADPKRYGIRNQNFTMLDISRRILLIGGTGYAGEMKKGIFTALNYLLPVEHGVLPMHCSANVGESGDTALFFGLSGTGKTTLSADPQRGLIGDDEHGWADQIFNFEGGCYAKVVELSAEKEPQIFAAIRPQTIVENTRFFQDSCQINFDDKSITENTRAAYPINFIQGAVSPSVGVAPRHIFFLTADAFGVLPPLSKLTAEQAMYHFMSGYTSKVAGTEMGVSTPQTTFSACFGAAFLPLHPTRYAELLGQKLQASDVQVWLVNTGWVGGGYGLGQRMALAHTRALISAVLSGKLDEVAFESEPVFGLAIPNECPGVPGALLRPRDTWADALAYDQQAMKLVAAFQKNFEKYQTQTNLDILNGGPLR
jgi:phosphoenolpyruvate carboxykinase (ATP)